MPDINMQVFEEAQRNQLVTEVDIQTQVALDDYQVQLSDIANPTQSHDNVVIDRFGEFLPHWNESLDFDTWVKMSMEIAGKRILMLRGNSNVDGVSNGDNTFMFFDDASGTLSDKWDISGGSNEGAFSYSSGYIQSVISSNQMTRLPIINSLPVSDYIVEWDGYISGTNGLSAMCVRWSDVDNNYELQGRYDFGSSIIIENVAGSRVAISTESNVVTEDTWQEYKAVVEGQNFELFVDDVHKVGVTDSSHSSGKIGLMAYYSAGTQRWDDVRVRKYTATEPTWLADDVPKNVITALKSFGRAG